MTQTRLRLVSSPSQLEVAVSKDGEAQEHADRVIRNILDLAFELTCQLREAAGERRIMNRVCPALQDGFPRLAAHLSAETRRLEAAVKGGGRVR